MTEGQRLFGRIHYLCSKPTHRHETKQPAERTAEIHGKSIHSHPPAPLQLWLRGGRSFLLPNLQALQPLLKDNAVNWVQIHGLQDAETIRELCQHFGIDFLTTQDILNADHQTKIEIHDTYNLVIIKQLIPLDDDEYQPQQLCIVQGTNYVLTFAETDTDFLKTSTRPWKETC